MEAEMDLDKQTALVPVDMQETWKTLGRALAKERRLSQQVMKASERWDLRQLRQRLPELEAAAAEVAASAQNAERLLADWSAAASSDGVSSYAVALEQAVRQSRLPLNGEFPEYEVFPLALRLDLSGEQATIGRRKTSTLEPSALAREVQRLYQALHSSSFNARRFIEALVESHELLKASGKAKGRAVQLSQIYGLLTLRTGSAGYTKQEFAFDIYRLRRESDLVHAGKRLAFQHAKNGGTAVPNAQGGVDMFGTLEVWEVEGSE
ncbi:MAG: hypothetical protein M0Z66_01680 [Thermaerobacter sp.]|nr:hypothetical protein [Thermaerobacter sp.]